MIDNELGADVRALLGQGRDHFGPDAATIARLRSRIDSAVATVPASAAKALGVKLTIVAVTATVGAGVYRFVDARIDAVALAAPQIAVLEPDSELELRSSLASQEPSPPSAPSSEPAMTIEASVALVPSPVAVEPAVEAAALAPSPEPGISLAREIELVDRAALGLRRRDFDAALRALHSYAGETKGGGQLAQDAAAIEVEVLCRLDDPKAPAQLAGFDQRWPQSAHRIHLRATCAHRKESK
jgi:hypothetical protein